MNKKIIATSLIFCCAAIFICAQEIVIESASPISSGNKTTLAINYSGSGRIQFFAVHDEGSLTVDFPGVVSNFDFSLLEFNQIKSIEQAPLDPDSNRGLSVKFSLAENVGYQFFDGEKGSVILLFETIGTVEKQPEALSAQVEELPISNIQEVSDVAIPANSYVLEGVGDDAFLKSVRISQQGMNIQIFAETQNIQSYKYFYLTRPDRYVIDLYGIVCQLDKDQMEFSGANVKKIRIKQFQVHPIPITRLVLDLDEPLEVHLTENIEGILTLTAGSVIQPEVALAGTMSVSKNEIDLSNEHVTLPTVENEQLVVEISSVIEKTDKFETSNVQDQAELEVSVTEPIVVVAPIESHDDMNHDLREDNNQSPTMLQEEPIKPLEENVVESDDLAMEIIEADPRPKTAVEPEVLPKKQAVVSNPATPKAKHQLPFMVANAVDQELEYFIKSEKTFYSVMKDAKPLKPKAKNLVVTNYSIDKSLNHLSESNAMQSESEVKSEFENSSLFEEYSADDFGDDRIAGGEQKYKGFEIQGIDVVDVNVTDLLRFFADQVGFNLYVDPSVKSLKATYKFANIPWDQAMDIILRNAGLDYQYNNGVLRVATTRKFKDEAVARRELLIEQELSVPPETVTFRLSYAKASEIAPIVSEYLSPRGSLLLDERTNILIIEDIPKKMIAIRSLIKKLDTQIPQVTIESRIVETTKRFMRELGIQWGLSGIYAPEFGTQTGMTFPNRVTVGGPRLGGSTNGIEGGYAVSFPVIDESPAGIGFSLGNILDTFKLDISLQMLESDGLGQIISAPKITTQNNKTAIIQNGQKIPIQTVQRGTITVRYVNAVLELEVTPHITSEKTIIMDLVIDKSEPDYTRDVLGNPIINIRRAETRVLVKDGGTAVIGGIYVLNEQNSTKGVPGLKKVPFVRRIFGSERKTIENQELLIFVTPRIVKY